MFFLNHPLGRDYFKKHGRVLTLRAQRRVHDGLQVMVHGSRFKHESLGYVQITYLRSLATLSPRCLAPYSRFSGFGSGVAWIEAYRHFTQGKMPLPVHLYEAKRVKAVPKKKAAAKPAKSARVKKKAKL